jgi:Holliday junction resolvase RusA-like endonuclease
MNILEFTFHDTLAKGASRPRTTKRGHIYQPPKDKDYKLLLQTDIMFSLPKEYRLHTGPVSIDIQYYVPLPKSANSLTKQLAQTGAYVPLSKPDVDNVSKLILDSMNGLVFYDDAQVTKLCIEKYYTTSTPYIQVKVILTEQPDTRMKGVKDV